MFAHRVMLSLCFLHLLALCIFYLNSYFYNEILIIILGGEGEDRSRGYIDVRLQSRDEQSHQIGRDIYIQCAVQGSVERPYEYTFTKDGRQLENSKIKYFY